MEKLVHVPWKRGVEANESFEPRPPSESHPARVDVL